MKRVFIITGANGHLGGALVAAAARRRCGDPRADPAVRSGAGERRSPLYPRRTCAIRRAWSPLFARTEGARVCVIHTAGIVDISEHVSPAIYDVNVNGTRNVIALCREHGARLVYVSSVHAIPEGDDNEVQAEVGAFSPDRVVGGYAKTKAGSDAGGARRGARRARRRGRTAVGHPRSLRGVGQPHGADGRRLRARQAAGVRRWRYDFVDVRDVAKGCVQAAEKGRSGECYILSNRRYEIRDLLKMIRAICGGRRLPVLPMWMAKAAAPLLQVWAKMRHERPLYTRYSLYALCSNSKFSHDKATMELGYRPRDLFQTMKDTVAWLRRPKGTSR